MPILYLATKATTRSTCRGATTRSSPAAGNDFVRHDSAGSPQLFGNEGNDTIYGQSAGPRATIVGGNDSADGSDSLVGTIRGADIVFGNGGADTIDGNGGADTVIGGFGTD